MDEKQRFEMELEFVQCLANPTYLHHLAQRRLFDDEAFVNYLKYLQYWKKEPYCQYIVYPHCLYMLDLLQHDKFRQELVKVPFLQFIHEQQYLHYLHHKVNRLDSKEDDQANGSADAPGNNDATGA